MQWWTIRCVYSLTIKFLHWFLNFNDLSKQRYKERAPYALWVWSLVGMPAMLSFHGVNSVNQSLAQKDSLPQGPLWTSNPSPFSVVLWRSAVAFISSLFLCYDLCIFWFWIPSGYRGGYRGGEPATFRSPAVSSTAWLLPLGWHWHYLSAVPVFSSALSTLLWH